MSKEFELKYSGENATGLIKSMSTLKEKLDKLRAEKTAIQKEYDYLRLNCLPGAMDEEELDTLTVTGVGRVSLTSDLYASIPAGTKPEAWQWLRDNGHGYLIVETVNAGSFKAACKQMIKKGEQIPEDLFKITPYTRASITKIS